jgi:hypothetical protein
VPGTQAQGRLDSAKAPVSVPAGGLPGLSVALGLGLPRLETDAKTLGSRTA